MKHALAPFFLVSTLLSVGCSASGPVYTPAPPSTDARLGTVEIYRPDAFAAGGCGFRVYVDGQKVVTLWNNGYTRVQVPPGEHVLDIGVFSPPLYLAMVFSHALKFDVAPHGRTRLCLHPGFMSAHPRVDTTNDIATTRFETPEREQL
jgi:hypothetical protein